MHKLNSIILNYIVNLKVCIFFSSVSAVTVMSCIFLVVCWGEGIVCHGYCHHMLRLRVGSACLTVQLGEICRVGVFAYVCMCVCVFLCVLMLNGSRYERYIIENARNLMPHFIFSFVYLTIEFRVILVLEVMNLMF